MPVKMQFHGHHPYFRKEIPDAVSSEGGVKYEPRHENTGFLHMRKQRRRSASR